MNLTLIIAVVASLCVGGAVGAGTIHFLVERPACAGNDAAWKKFIDVPPLPTNTGKNY
jgi:hypothetical protein